MSIKSVIPPSHLILCRPLLLPSIFPSIKVFSSESVLCIRWLKYGSFSFSISPSNEYSGLTDFRMDWLDLLAVQRTLKSLLQHHSSKSISSSVLSFLYGPSLISIHEKPCLFLWPHGLSSPWNSPGQNTGVCSLFLVMGIFPTQGLNPGLLHCRWILYQLSHKGSPIIILKSCFWLYDPLFPQVCFYGKIAASLHLLVFWKYLVNTACNFFFN